MANEIMIPTGNVPAHVSSLFAQLAGINKDATDGISAGMYPFIKLSSTRFVLVRDGEETSVKSLELKVVVLKAKPGFEKRFYIKKYDPNSTEVNAPDCYSMDGIRPDAGCAHPQNTACAGCKQNQFGTGTTQDGSLGKGKACSDRKVLAVLYPNPDTKKLEIYGFSLPPASLKAFGSYVQQLSNNNIPLPAAFTIVGFDEKQSTPVLTFKFGGLMGEKELGAVVPMIDSPEVKTIMEFKAPAVSPVAPVNAIKHEEPKQEEQGGFGFEPETTPAPAAEPAKERKPRAPKAKQEPAMQETPDAEVETADASGAVSDDELAAMMGLNL